MKKWLAQLCFERMIITSLESFSSLLFLDQAHGKQKKRTRHKKFRIKSNKYTYFMGEEEDDWFSYCCNVMKVEIKSGFFFEFV